jgi:peroxiredoxin
VAQLDGDSVTLGAVPDRTERQVLFLFTTTCPYCRAALPTWRTLADSLRRTASRIQVLGVSLDSAGATRDYRAAHQLDFPVGLLASPKYVALYKAMAVPQTVVLDADGRVRYATIGTLGTRAILDSIYHAALDGDPPATRIVACRSPASRSDR